MSHTGLTSGLPAWSTDPGELARVSVDRSGVAPDGLPDLVVFAQSVRDVRRTVSYAASRGVPVVPRGAGSGVAGGAVAGAGEIVLDLSGLDRIADLRPDDALAVVEPGVITADLDAAAHPHGLRYAPDPASAAFSTIGGNIATNAGGLRCVKYGVTRDAVLAVDAVLGDGSLVSTGRRTVKGVTGYDLTGLLVGSEGTLGVVVGATLRLSPLPTTTATAAAFFATADDAVAAVTSLQRRGLRPSTAELLDQATLRAIDDAQGTALHTRGEVFLLLQTDGYGAEAELAEAERLLRPSATHLETTTDPETAARLVAVRRAALPAVERYGRVLIEDIAVPRSRIAESITAVGDIARRTGVRIVVFAHAGDGNLHPIVVADSAPPERVDEAVAAIFEHALAVGGTLTGEHGVGTLKRPWLADELGEPVLDLHRRLKSVFDPAGILNPGKAIR
ncbi:FAD-linked oxidase C-terminal domain-containing protein [Saccharothrix violaceirubra]|uniref:Glycolate oxidase n=1 Tax=Saccharothrix violaceirubra TaxID=413306 RepID=A0A7W7T3T0_9PSEU|nr:FAD-linked oxidase C-terminal domain-containing protein [Saccharothrix violaceirubra]MBB4966067.1 glycolate oxidase [Saccharothrix violaceirubra]